MRVTNRMMMDTVLRNLSRNQRRLDTLQERLSSGKAISRPSDDPEALFQAANARSDISQIGQYLENVDLAKGWLEASQSSLGGMLSLMERARILAIQGSNETLGDDEMHAIAAEVGEL
ncbi:MAG: flagellar hook-associated protein FlgL, partial [Chloroflexota bacterium]